MLALADDEVEESICMAGLLGLSKGSGKNKGSAAAFPLGAFKKKEDET